MWNFLCTIFPAQLSIDTRIYILSPVNQFVVSYLSMSPKALVGPMHALVAPGAVVSKPVHPAGLPAKMVHIDAHLVMT